MKRANTIRNILLLSQGFIIAAFAMLSPIYAIFVEKIGGGILAAGGSVAAYSVTTGLLIFMISRWEDHVKHLEKLVILGYALSALGFLGYIFVQNITQLIFIQILLGLSVAIRAPAFDAMYSRHLDHGKGASEWGNWESMVYITTAIAALIGGYVAKNYGFTALFTIMFASSLIALIFSINKGKAL